MSEASILEMSGASAGLVSVILILYKLIKQVCKTKYKSDCETNGLEIHLSNIEQSIKEIKSQQTSPKKEEV
jgi:hypothetical protein